MNRGKWWWGRWNAFQQRCEQVWRSLTGMTGVVLSGQRRGSVQGGTERTRVAKCRCLERNGRPQWEASSPFCLHVQLAWTLECFLLHQSLWEQNHIPCACLKNLKKRTHTHRTGSLRQLMAASQVQRIYKGSAPARWGKGMGRGGRKGELRRTAQLQSNSQSQPVWRALWKRTVLHVNFCFGEKNDAFLLCREEVPFSHWQTLSLCIQQSLGRAMIQEGMG